METLLYVGLYLVIMGAFIWAAISLSSRPQTARIAMFVSLSVILIDVYLAYFQYHILPHWLGGYLFYVIWADYWVMWFATFFLLVSWRQVEDQRSGKMVAILAIVLGLYMSVDITRYIWDRNHSSLQDWVNGEFCSQSTGYSCAPASMVNLLRHYGISSTEWEMAQLAMTRSGSRGGTNLAGIYYGLNQKVKGKYRVVINRLTIKELKKLNHPALVTIRLAFLLDHSILVKKFDGDNFHLLDPLPAEIEKVSPQDFHPQWKGDVIYIVKSESRESLK